MHRFLKIIFFAILVKPLVFIILGLNIRGRENLPSKGPAVLLANHNSHLDTMVLMSLYPLKRIHKVRPVAAADYFLESGRLRAWFSKNVIGIIPMDRSGGTAKENLFDGCNATLDNGEILILFPEGSRGEPEQISLLKKGAYHLLVQRGDTQATPIMMHGLGRALPKGESLLVPFNCDVIIGASLHATGTADAFVDQIAESFNTLQEFCLTMEHVDKDKTDSA